MTESPNIAGSVPEAPVRFAVSPSPFDEFVRKYGTTPDGLPAVLADFLAQREALDGSGTSLKDAQAAVSKAHQAYLDAARKLSKSRAAAAKKLEAAVAAELTPLKLGHAKFRVALEALPDDAGTASGLEKIAFEVATVEGAAFGSLAKIASGGELARFSLALKVALAQTSPQPPWCSTKWIAGSAARWRMRWASDCSGWLKPPRCCW